MAITAYSKARRFLSTKLTPPDDEQHALKDLKGRALSSVPCLLCILLSPAEDAHHLYLHWSWCGAWWAITPTHSTHKIVTRWQSNWGKEQKEKVTKGCDSLLSFWRAHTVRHSSGRWFSYLCLLFLFCDLPLLLRHKPAGSRLLSVSKLWTHVVFWFNEGNSAENADKRQILIQLWSLARYKWGWQRDCAGAPCRGVSGDWSHARWEPWVQCLGPE